MSTVKKSRSGKRVARRKEVLLVQESRHQLKPRVAIGALPGEVLLEIFDFYLVGSYGEGGWQTLVHVCKWWRCIVFASPQRLQLQLVCTNKTPVQNSLDVWPEFPIVIEGRPGAFKPQDANNIIAALQQHNRVCRISISEVPSMVLKKIRVMKMGDPFPALTSLWLRSYDYNAHTLPDAFLASGGSAPRLREIYLNGIPFPRLPKLLLSTPDIIKLELWDIPHSGYISPEAMVTGLSALARLQTLHLKFRSPRSRADRENRLPPRSTRCVLPALTTFEFRGEGEYLEDIVAQIDAPRLDRLKITFFNQLIFDTPLLRHFISRIETVKLPHRAYITFANDSASFDLARQDGNGKWGPSVLSSSILSRPSDWQLSSLAQICDSVWFSPTIGHLEITSYNSWRNDMDNSQFLELLNPFTSLKVLVLRGNLIQLVALALEDLTGERVTEVLPALQKLFLYDERLSESVKEVIGKFIAARQLSDRPVAVEYNQTYWPYFIS